jgi:hypothetical protein
MANGSETRWSARAIHPNRLIIPGAALLGAIVLGGAILGVALALSLGSGARAATLSGFDVPETDRVPGFEPAQIGVAPVNAAAAALKPTAVAGRYAILRAAAKDTGCMLTLDDKGKGQGGYTAHLSPACADQDMVMFGPAFWQLVKGRLVLSAHKGHKTRLDLQADGTWEKNPTDGKPLILKKM